MKALNNKEITNKYLIFLLNFTILLICTIGCYFLYLKADVQQSDMIERQQKAYNYIFAKREQLSVTIDTLNTYLGLLGTKQVENEVALERTILKLKNEASKELDVLKENGDASNYALFEKIIANVEKTIDGKHLLQQAKTEEELQTKKLIECIDANKKADQVLQKGK